MKMLKRYAMAILGAASFILAALLGLRTRQRDNAREERTEARLRAEVQEEEAAHSREVKQKTRSVEDEIRTDSPGNRRERLRQYARDNDNE